MGPDATISLCLAGDTMLGRGVAEVLNRTDPGTLFSSEVVALISSADLVVLNLECCISERGEPWPAPGKPFFFRAPPAAAELLARLRVDCVTLANNHALDYGYDALQDTFTHLENAGVMWAGAGRDLDEATSLRILDHQAFRLGVLGVTDHPSDYAARRAQPGVALAELRHGVPDWVIERITSCDADALVVTPHWGPNMTSQPEPYVAAAARELTGAGATLVAGHSAHVFHGIHPPVLFDLGDFVDDYAVDPILRNDLGLLWFVTLDGTGPRRIEAVPLKLDYCHTRVATGDDQQWVVERFRTACAAMGTEVGLDDDRLVIINGYR